MKIANIEEENLHIFWTTLGTSMKFLGKMWLVTILKVTEKQAFKLSLKNTFLEKPQGGVQLTLPSYLRVKNWAIIL